MKMFKDWEQGSHAALFAFIPQMWTGIGNRANSAQDMVEFWLPQTECPISSAA